MQSLEAIETPTALADEIWAPPSPDVGFCVLAVMFMLLNYSLICFDWPVSKLDRPRVFFLTPGPLGDYLV